MPSFGFVILLTITYSRACCSLHGYLVIAIQQIFQPWFDSFWHVIKEVVMDFHGDAIIGQIANMDGLPDPRVLQEGDVVVEVGRLAGDEVVIVKVQLGGIGEDINGRTKQLKTEKLQTKRLKQSDHLSFKIDVIAEKRI